MKKLLLLLAPLAACAGLSAPAGGPIGHPTLCGECTHPCPNTERVCNKVEPAAAPAPAPVAVPKQAAAATTFDPAPGSYPAGQLVTLSTTTPNAVIHYTTDGSTPTDQSPVYTGPFRVESGTTVKAIAIAPGMAASEVSSGTYEIERPAPPPPPARVTVEKGKLELKDKVFFDTGKATIKPESHSILDEAAAVLQEHAEVKRVRIEGHTDNVGSAALNKKLSAARAAAVRSYLIEKGVDAKRVESAGFGAARPVADNKTAAGREKNRRVEFVIVEK